MLEQILKDSGFTFDELTDEILQEMAVLEDRGIDPLPLYDHNILLELGIITQGGE